MARNERFGNPGRSHLYFHLNLTMSPRQYSYVGPNEILLAASTAPPGVVIQSVSELQDWLTSNTNEAEKDGSIIATFVIDQRGRLRLAPRRSEHVACANGGPVLSAGEITFSPNCDVLEATNQSTGFCPEPESWPSVC